MIQIDNNQLPENLELFLKNLQLKVDSKNTFSEKVLLAKSLWETKGGKIGKVAFGEIKNILETMCVSINTCNYCEQSEAGDIEHIYPKSFFPESAFIWTNYLFACKQCNTGLKLDKCYVIDDANNLIYLERGLEPIYKNIAFINPRIENPNSFMYLNMETWTFDILDEISIVDKFKAEKTIEILELNTKDILKEKREKISFEIYDKLERFSKIKMANSIDEIKIAHHPLEDIFDFTLPIEELKKQKAESVKKHIKKAPHPTVWYFIKKISSKTNRDWQKIFQVVPEALDW